MGRVVILKPAAMPAQAAEPSSTGSRRTRPKKAGPVHLSVSMTVAEGFPLVIAACLKHFRMNEELLVREQHAEALHQARIALRRLRSALALFKPAFKGREFNRFRDHLRKVTRLMGAARNLDVMLAGLPAEDPRRQRMESDRQRHYAKMRKTLTSASFRNQMLLMVGWAHEGSWRTSKRARAPLLRFAVKRLDRIWRKLERRGIYLAALPDKQRHRLRIDTKKLRYALEFFCDPLRQSGPAPRKFVRRAEGLQNSLGRLNDLATAQGHGAIGDEIATAADEAREMRAAGRHFRQMREIGPYWREAAAG